MENKRNLLVTLADRNYIKQAKQLFSSVYWNAGWKGDYMLLAHEIPEKELKWFRDKGILVRKCKPLYNKAIGNDGHPGVVITKFYLFTPEFKKWKNIVYLDADIIVRASLDELTKVKGFAAIPDIYLDNIGKLVEQFINKQLSIFSEIKRKYYLNTASFNGGVIAFNSDIIKEDSFNEINQLFDKYKEISKYGDQTILNLFFYKKWTRFPSVYNTCVNYVSKNPPRKAIILHFAGIDELTKPWNPKSIFYHEWKNNLDKAELIDLDHIPGGKKWTKFEIIRHLLKTRLRHFLFSISAKIDKFIGKTGILIKKINPFLYHKLKKINNGK